MRPSHSPVGTTGHHRSAVLPPPALSSFTHPWRRRHPASAPRARAGYLATRRSAPTRAGARAGPVTGSPHAAESASRGGAPRPAAARVHRLATRTRRWIGTCYRVPWAPARATQNRAGGWREARRRRPEGNPGRAVPACTSGTSALPAQALC
eukprot:scaffold27724_cov97-Isochrysis_galbana.AAC.2